MKVFFIHSCSWNSCLIMLSLVQSPLDVAGTNSATFEFLMDCGCTETLGNLSDIRQIDPWDQLPQAGVTRVCISNGTIVDRPYYNVDIRINVPDVEGGGSIANWRRVRYKVATNNVQRLSGLFPFKHTYLAKGPHH